MHRNRGGKLMLPMLTALTSQLSRYAGLGYGANDYVTKPVTPEHLISRIELLLPESPIFGLNRTANTGLSFPMQRRAIPTFEAWLAWKRPELGSTTILGMGDEA